MIVKQLKNITALIRLINIISILSISIILPKSLYSGVAKIVARLFKLHGTAIFDKSIKMKNGYPQIAPILLFNHPTGWDHIVLLSHLGPIRFLVFQKYMIGVSYYIAKRLGCVSVRDGSNTVKDLIKSINPNSPIAIAPTGGQSLDNPSVLPKFRSGAFITSIETNTPIQPVVIVYHPYTRWQDNMSIFQLLWNRLTGSQMEYTLHILPQIQPIDNIEEYKHTAKTLMEKTLYEIYQKKYPNYLNSLIKLVKSHNSYNSTKSSKL